MNIPDKPKLTIRKYLWKIENTSYFNCFLKHSSYFNFSHCAQNFIFGFVLNHCFANSSLICQKSQMILTISALYYFRSVWMLYTENTPQKLWYISSPKTSRFMKTFFYILKKTLKCTLRKNNWFFFQIQIKMYVL